nr:hypothetical protein CFP56_69543 [Quercus suber]
MDICSMESSDPEFACLKPGLVRRTVVRASRPPGHQIWVKQQVQHDKRRQADERSRIQSCCMYIPKEYIRTISWPSQPKRTQRTVHQVKLSNRVIAVHVLTRASACCVFHLIVDPKTLHPKRTACVSIASLLVDRRYSSCEIWPALPNRGPLPVPPAGYPN